MQKYTYVQCTDGLHMRSRFNIADLLSMHRPSVQHMCSRSDVYWTHWTYCACATQLICTHTVATALTELPDIQMARVLKSHPEKKWRWNKDVWFCLALFLVYNIAYPLFSNVGTYWSRYTTSSHFSLKNNSPQTESNSFWSCMSKNNCRKQNRAVIKIFLCNKWATQASLKEEWQLLQIFWL